MALTITELELYKDITSGTYDSSQNYTPASGSFYIYSIVGEAAFDMNCAVKVLFGGDIIWCTKGSSSCNKKRPFQGDGVKKVELVLDAVDLSSGSVFLGGSLTIEQGA